MNERERIELKSRMDKIRHENSMEIPSVISKVSNDFTNDLINSLTPFIKRGDFENKKGEFVHVIFTCLSLIVSKEIIRLVKNNFADKELLVLCFAERLEASFKAEELREKYPELFKDH